MDRREWYCHDYWSNNKSQKFQAFFCGERLWQELDDSQNDSTDPVTVTQHTLSDL